MGTDGSSTAHGWIIVYCSVVNVARAPCFYSCARIRFDFAELVARIFPNG